MSRRVTETYISSYGEHTLSMPSGTTILGVSVESSFQIPDGATYSALKLLTINAIPTGQYEEVEIYSCLANIDIPDGFVYLQSVSMCYITSVHTGNPGEKQNTVHYNPLHVFYRTKNPTANIVIAPTPYNRLSHIE